jgi:hypothetical protein
MTCAVVMTAACSTASTQPNSALGPAADSTPTGTGETPKSEPTTPAGGQKTTAKPQTPADDWPSPADCVSYNPANLTVAFANGAYTVSDGGKKVLTVSGYSGDNTGDQALALAKRYKKHCYIGRDNNREDHNQYVFDYWRNPSGVKTTIPGEDDMCSDYDRGNLTVEDMGDGNGWRVKDHDHVLHLFDNGKDAHAGDIVLSKYDQICQIGSGSDEDDNLRYVTYSR